MSYNTAPVQTELVIGGEWREATGGGHYEIQPPI